MVERGSLIELENRKRTLDLREQRQQGRQFSGFQRVAKIIVQRAFNRREVDLDFLADLKNQQAFLRTLADVVHQRIRVGGNIRQNSAGHGAFDACDDAGNLRRKIGG